MVKPFGLEPVDDSSKCNGCSKHADVKALFGIDNAIIVRYYCTTCLEGAEVSDTYAPIEAFAKIA